MDFKDAIWDTYIRIRSYDVIYFCVKPLLFSRLDKTILNVQIKFDDC